MAVSVASGVVDTDAILADEKVVDMQPKHRMATVDEQQFMTILNKLPGQSATREKFNWLEDDFFPNLSQLAASATSAETAVTVSASEGDYFRAGDLIRFQDTGEIAEVVSVATDTLTIDRSVGEIAAASAASTCKILIVSNASAQGADYGTLKVTNRVLNYNYTQIVRHPFGVTGTQEQIETYGAKGYLANETAKKGVEHKRALENMLWVGGRNYASSDSTGYSGGVREFISTNVSASVGTLSLSGLDAALEDIFQFGSMEKVIFAAPGPAGALSRLLSNNWVRARPEDKVYGAKVTAFVNGAYGASVPVITKREWGREGTGNEERGGWMVVIDLSNVRKRPLRNRSTRLLRERQGNGIDGTVHEFLTEMGLEFAVEKSHGILKGITG